MELMGSGGSEQQDEGLPGWILAVCLVICAVVCVLMLRFTIGVLNEAPADTTPTTARPAP